MLFRYFFCPRLIVYDGVWGKASAMGTAEQRRRAVALSAFDLPDSGQLLVHRCENCACAVPGRRWRGRRTQRACQAGSAALRQSGRAGGAIRRGNGARPRRGRGHQPATPRGDHPPPGHHLRPRFRESTMITRWNASSVVDAVRFALDRDLTFSLSFRSSSCRSLGWPVRIRESYDDQKM